ncbi:MAG TPA: flagellar motor protein MotB [Methylococcaceae bacterium]|jgi:OOP family OmpA-OmpF porin|nr:flagellar motor protein MotB [Methylococcaceae bacterium]
MFTKTLLALSLAGFAAFAQAGETPAVESSTSSEFTDDRFYVAPFGSFIEPAGSRNTTGGWGGGMAIGKIINEYFNVEVKGFWQGWNQNGLAAPGSALTPPGAYKTGRTDFTGGTIDLQYYFFRDDFSPYVVFGIGGANTSTRNVVNVGGTTISAGRSTSGFVFEAGAGATYELADNFLLRGDVRYRGVTTSGVNGPLGSNYNPNGVFNDLVVNMGFEIPLGDKPAKAASTPVVADSCASRDSDNDGVNDCDDKCPGTASGTKVDDQGCPIVMELRGVNFHFDSAELTDGAKHILDGVVEQLVAMPTKKDIEVAGYASFEGVKGKEQHNLHLSQRRSESVAHYLKKKGISNKLFAKGYGTQFPVADNNTESGRVKNRRVELRWIGD